MDSQSKERIKEIVGKEQERSNRRSFWGRVFDVFRVPFFVRKDSAGQTVQFIKTNPDVYGRPGQLNEQNPKATGFNQNLAGFYLCVCRQCCVVRPRYYERKVVKVYVH